MLEVIAAILCFIFWILTMIFIEIRNIRIGKGDIDSFLAFLIGVGFALFGLFLLMDRFILP